MTIKKDNNHHSNVDKETQKSKNETDSLFKQIPGVDHLLEMITTDLRFKEISLTVIKSSIRAVLEKFRKSIRDGNSPDLSRDSVVDHVLTHARKTIAPRLVPTINATGVVLHTNLGRALLADEAMEQINGIAASFSNLEFEIGKGKRGERYSAVESLLCELTGAEAALAVNNNAGAVLLSLNTLAMGREVVVSRGELVEIGGSFRIPDVMEKSGSLLKEVGTTNRTHLRDYENAVTEKTGLLLKVHTSNYTIEGFTASVAVRDMAELGKRTGVPVMEDLGSGSLIDLSKYGLGREPTVSESIASGAGVVTFSGDKLLGGPQAGIIVGSRDAIQKIKANPLTRALRIDKLTLAALEATLGLYRDETEAIRKIPTLRMLTRPFKETAAQAESMIDKLKSRLPDSSKIADVGHADLSSRTGGGSYPELAIASRCITISPNRISAAQLEKRMRMFTPAIIGRIESDRVIIDPRTLQMGEGDIVINALAEILNEMPETRS